jgi:hypothetical protein
MSALLAYTTNPNPAILAGFNTRYQLAAAEWNDAVEPIWRAARRAPPSVPTG